VRNFIKVIMLAACLIIQNTAWSDEELLIGFAGSGTETAMTSFSVGYCSDCKFSIDWKNLDYSTYKGAYRQYVSPLLDHVAISPIYESYRRSNCSSGSGCYDSFVVEDILLSAYAPAITYFNGSIYTAYVDRATQEVRMAYSDDDGYSWQMINNNRGRVLTLRSAGRPALLGFGDHLYLAVRGLSSKSLYIAKSNNGKDWLSSDLVVPGDKSASGPSLTVLGDTMYLAFRGASTNYIYYKTSVRGGVWSAAKRIRKHKTSNTPYIASYDGKLHLAYKGSSSNNLYMLSSVDGVNWSNERRLPSSIKSNRGPAIAPSVMGGELYIAFKHISTSQVLYSKSIDGLNWSAPVSKEFSKTSGSLSLTQTHYGYLR